MSQVGRTAVACLTGEVEGEATKADNVFRTCQGRGLRFDFELVMEKVSFKPGTLAFTWLALTFTAGHAYGKLKSSPGHLQYFRIRINASSVHERGCSSVCRWILELPVAVL